MSTTDVPAEAALDHEFDRSRFARPFLRVNEQNFSHRTVTADLAETLCKNIASGWSVQHVSRHVEVRNSVGKPGSLLFVLPLNGWRRPSPQTVAYLERLAEQAEHDGMRLFAVISDEGRSPKDRTYAWLEKHGFTVLGDKPNSLRYETGLISKSQLMIRNAKARLESAETQIKSLGMTGACMILLPLLFVADKTMSLSEASMFFVGGATLLASCAFKGVKWMSQRLELRDLLAQERMAAQTNGAAVPASASSQAPPAMSRPGTAGLSASPAPAPRVARHARP